MQQDPTTYSKEDQSKFVDAWEDNIEKIERNRRIMREGAKSAKIFKNLGIIAEEGYNIRKVKRLP
tara:strand:+ start:1739 stop:1933 length:195 start_codon:yes stop_codon:yes gene_type:complete